MTLPTSHPDPRLDPGQAWGLEGMGPYVSDRLQDSEPSRPGWTVPVLLVALGPEWEWEGMLQSWRRLGRYQAQAEFEASLGDGIGPGRRVLDEGELASALAELRQRIERMVDGLRPPREGD